MWLGAPIIRHYLWILTSLRGQQVSGSSSASCGHQQISNLRLQSGMRGMFIKPKKMMPGFLKTRNNNCTLRSPGQTLTDKTRASYRNISLNHPAYLERKPELCRLFELKLSRLSGGRSLHHPLLKYYFYSNASKCQTLFHDIQENNILHVSQLPISTSTQHLMWDYKLKVTSSSSSPVLSATVLLALPSPF